MDELGLSSGVLIISKSGTTSVTNARNDLLEVGLAGVIRSEVK
jgi:hypothetical protein